ncbi:OmpA family protein [Mucilaginibacter gotjawali]|uniref:Outer membrane protein OmpA-like peptidoglycan-associated protein n=2 Tax=Mucilaginibacter gotjawali TaxID=1550579 RepID=A0A839SP29_9SPHI|nr:OmpA family protein [Mucilaginibacter gotjawali]MBB3059133.1 outer membrane protein OmpA-like peptidoglycan-associated protein [Mucilaginibacter gotjawali]BAU52124.1 Peptidoglycan-associated lipoprotein precursor [Mucilaginibacter gotjawali]
MKRLMIIGLCTLILAKYAGAQEQLSIKQQADNYYVRYEYFKSLNLYLKLVKKKTDIRILERIADCYRNINRYEDAETWYAKATTDLKASKISHYYYAEVLLRDEKFDLAKQQFGLYYGGGAVGLSRKLALCDSAALWMRSASAYKIKNYTKLNTSFSDWGLTYYGKTGLFFTSDRIADENDLDYRTGNNWFKLYECDTSGTRIGAFDVVNSLGQSYNDYYHFGPIVLNKTADTAYITVTTARSAAALPTDTDSTPGKSLYSRRLHLLMAHKKKDQWVVGGDFPYDNVEKYSVGEAALSKDGKTIYFTSDMPGGFGKTDLWYCEKRTDGSWGIPINCGKNINTAEEDAFPVIGGDGNLYYASKGLPGMGGYDIYCAKGQKDQWSTPVNLKYPINSTSDDFYLVTNDGKSGYLSSNREGGQGGDDIYSFIRIDSIPLKQIVKVKTPEPVAAKTQSKPNIVINNIYYDLDKADIRPDAAAELDKLVVLLKQYPAIKIELSSYTDSRASDQYNISLSQRRAAAVVVYLVDRGISGDRLVIKYYGKTHLVNGCTDDVKCTEAEHQLNRRTEFRVME